VLPIRDTIHFPLLVNPLVVGREMSHRALHCALRGDRQILVLAQNDMSVESPRGEDLCRIGTLSEVIQMLPMPDGNFRVMLRTLRRVRVEQVKFKLGYLTGAFQTLEEAVSDGPHQDALRREAVATFAEIATLGKQVPIETLEQLPTIQECGRLADSIAHYLDLPVATKQGLLEELDCEKRLAEVLKCMASERQVLELQVELRSKIENELGNTQREYYLREQMRAIQSELKEFEHGDEIEEFLQKIEAAELPIETRQRAIAEVRRLERTPASSPEGMVIRNYLEWLVSMPWNVLSLDQLEIKRAEQQLDDDHFGLHMVKDRILDYLAVRELSRSLRGPILCFIGPPGVGKTSFGKSIADAMGRKFVRISLGGVRDEAEIRGHRRTYIGSMPGRIIQGIRTCGTRNPVMLLDEIDKMTADLRGDPTSALLEVLDPAQNSSFSDHYLEAPFDLSAVLFITTANLLENIPQALRDRMEVIQFPSYTELEKIEIAKGFLLPKAIAEHGLRPTQISLKESALTGVIRHYTREAGVRSLEREIAALCRKSARKVAEKKVKRAQITNANLADFLGPARYRFGTRGEHDEIGAATGLVYTAFGGDLVTIEVSLLPPLSKQPQIQLTGSLGAVMKESAQAAVTFVRSLSNELGCDSFAYDVHIHVPEGAIPKDGPSAGVTMTVALASALTRRKVRKDLAMTGEVTLRGRILPVGGVKEKCLAAHRAGIFEIMLPAGNLADLDSLPVSVRKDLILHPISEAHEAIDLALERPTARTKPSLAI